MTTTPAPAATATRMHAEAGEAAAAVARQLQANAPVIDALVARLLAPILRRFMKQRLQRLAASGHVETSVVQHSRARLERLARLGGQRSRGVQVEQQTIAKVSVEVLTPPDARPGSLMKPAPDGRRAR